MLNQANHLYLYDQLNFAILQFLFKTLDHWEMTPYFMQVNGKFETLQGGGETIVFLCERKTF